jgi:DNA primase
VGFGGRSIDGSEPKYLNSSESPIFLKGQLLYNLHAARHPIRKAERVLVVEGYFDVVRTVAAGIEEVVAPLGTALTIEQAKLMRRYSNNVFLLYDSDQAGLKATFRSGDVLLHEGASVRVVTLPEGDDPDTFVAKQGAEGLERELRAAVDVFDRKLQLLQRGGWFADLHKARRAIDRLIPTIRAAADPLTRELYLSRTAEVSRVDRETLARETAAMPDPVLASAPFDQPRPEYGSPAAPFDTRRSRSPKRRVGAEAERMLVRAMLVYRGRIDDITEALGRIDDEAAAGGITLTEGGPAPTLRDPVLIDIHHALLDGGSEADLAMLAEAVQETSVPTLEALAADPEEFIDVAATVDDSLDRLRIRWRQERIDALKASLVGMDRAAFAVANEELVRLKKEMVVIEHRRRNGAPS